MLNTFKFTVLVLSFILFSGCATPVTKEQITPHLYSLEKKEINLSIIDVRPYVLEENMRSEKFEGIIQDGFGIPSAVERPGRAEDERFVDFLSNLVKEGFNKAGIEVTVIRTEKGSTLGEAIKNVQQQRKDKSIIVQVYDSQYRGIYNYLYKYAFDFNIVNSEGEVIVSKSFSGSQANKVSSQPYSIFDMHAIIYKENFELMFNDEVIKNALVQ